MKRWVIFIDKFDNYDFIKVSDNDGDEEDGDDGVVLFVFKWINEFFWCDLV